MKIDKPIIYLITDGSLDSQNYSANKSRLIELMKVAVESKISMVQIREKNLPTRLLFKLAKEIVKIAQNSQTKILINDRADVALAAKADGVHLTSSSIPTKIVRQIFPKNFIISVSVHTLEKIWQAKNDGADFVVYSPIFYSPDKGKPQGIKKLSQVVKQTKGFPIIALGGINEENIMETLKCGANGIAAIRMLNNVKRLPTIVEKIRSVFND